MPDYDNSAVLCWPVEFIGSQAPDIQDAHVTIGYFPNVSDPEIPKAAILNGLKGNTGGGLFRSLKYRLGIWEVYKIAGVAAFGPENDHPVLLINDEYGQLKKDHELAKNLLKAEGIAWDKSYHYTPHITVDLRTVVSPPSKVILRPMELWYRGDKQVIE